LVERLAQDRLVKIRAARPPSSSASTNDLFQRFVDRYKGDYVGFTELLEIDSRSGRVPFRLNEIQKSYHENRTPRDVVLKARRVGMTTEAIARDLWFFLTQDIPSVTILCQSTSKHEPLQAIRAILVPFIDTLRAKGLPLNFTKESVSDWEMMDRGAALRIVEAGASVKAASKKGRAGRVTRLHATELAFYEYAGETMNALLECVAGPEFGTEIQYESTANGAAGDNRDDPKSASGAAVFHWAVQDAQRGYGGFKFHFVPWYADTTCRLDIEPGNEVAPQTERERQLVKKGVGPEQLYWYQRKLAEKKSQQLVDQEYPSDPDTCFLLSGRTFFEGARTQELLEQIEEPIQVLQIRVSGGKPQIVGTAEIPAIRIWHKAVHGKLYVLSVDTSEGCDGDASAGILYERGTGRHMATLWGQFKPWELGRQIIPLARMFNNAQIAVERIGYGAECIQSLYQHGYRNIFADHDEKLGWINSEPSRSAALARLEEAHRTKHFTTLDRFFLAEIRTFVWREGANRKMKAEAKKGSHDDLVMAGAIGWDVICRPLPRTRSSEGLPVA
jgi:hypothetical protein